LNESKPKAAVLEARIPADQNWVTHVKVVPAAKTGTETVVWNSAAAPGAKPERRLRALCCDRLLTALGSM
jgi:hypothetical protein